MPNPIAVLISDIHYSIPTLELADAVMRLAIAKANELNVPLIVAGDLHDTKANLRGECVNAMLKTFKEIETTGYILVGNHDKINEKSIDNSLQFLVALDTTWLVVAPCLVPELGMFFIPYQHDTNEFKKYLDTIPKNSTIIMHQGVHGSLSGEYIQDKSAVPKEWLVDYRVISGHYHTRQDIKCGRPQKGAVGLMSYIGNPYTLNFGEANDPEKGFQILNDDGTLTFVPTNLRKHVVFNLDLDTLIKLEIKGVFNQMRTQIKENDLVKVKFTGTKEEFNKITKEIIKKSMQITQDFKLELIPLDTKTEVKALDKNTNVNDTLDNIINDTPNASDEQKERLKQLWRDYANT